MTAQYAAPRISDARQTVPRVLLRAIGALLLVCLVMVAAARWSGMEPVASPPEAEVETMRRIVIAPKGEGVVVTDADTGALIADLEELGGGFVGGVHRAMARVRDTADAPALAPAELIRWQDGRLSLIDTATGWRVELQGFGDDNHRAFVALLRGATTGQSKGDVR
jgi:putative photosynthetic complex assembly protein